MTENTRNVPVRRFGTQPADGEDTVVIEEPLAIRVKYAGEESDLLVLMRTPGQDEELVTGLLLTEGVIDTSEQISRMLFPETNVVLAELADSARFDPELMKRNLPSMSSCGVCGKATLEALRASLSRAPVADSLTLEADVLRELPARMREAQPMFAATGALHAAALFGTDGQLEELAEDVGRHNAVDKVFGRALAGGRLPLTESVLVLSGRVSYELVQKAVMAGCPLIAAVGAPSSLAVELAWEFDVTLAGFLRDGRFNVYAAPRRIPGADR